MSNFVLYWDFSVSLHRLFRPFSSRGKGLHGLDKDMWNTDMFDMWVDSSQFCCPLSDFQTRTLTLSYP